MKYYLAKFRITNQKDGLRIIYMVLTQKLDQYPEVKSFSKVPS
jgi:hypothetical protein